MAIYRRRFIAAILLHVVWYLLFLLMPRVWPPTLSEFCIQVLACPVTILVLMFKVLVKGPRVAKLASVLVSLPSILMIMNLFSLAGY